MKASALFSEGGGIIICNILYASQSGNHMLQYTMYQSMEKESEKLRMMGNQSIDLSTFLCTKSDAWTRLVQSSNI